MPAFTSASSYLPVHSALHELLARCNNISFVAFNKEGFLCATHGSAFDHTISQRFVLGRNLEETLADLPDLYRAFCEALASGRKTVLPFQGQHSHFEMHVLPLCNYEGNIEGAVGLGKELAEHTPKELPELTIDTEHQLTNLLDNAQDGIFIINRKFVIQRYNPIVEQVNTPEPISGQVCHKRFFDFDEPCPYCPVRETFRTGQPAVSSCYHPRLHMHFTLSSTPLFDMHTGELVGAFETFRDITDLHFLEQTARSNERGQLMMDAIPICCCLLNEDLEMVDCNMEAVKFFQCYTKEKTCQSAMAMFPKNQQNSHAASSVTDLLRKTLAGNAFHAEWVFTLPGQIAVPAEVTLVPLVYNEKPHLAVYARDLRQEKAMRVEIEEANARVRAMFDNAPLGCTMTDPDFQAIDCNNQILRMHGLTDKVSYTEHFFELSPEFQPDGSLSAEFAAKHLNKAFEEGYDQFEWMHRTITGEELPVEITIIRVMVGDKPRVAGYVRDLRELKIAQKALDRERAELVLAKEAAEAASHTKSTFLANMSHEIRTPMNAILGLAYLALQNENIPQAQRDTFSQIHSAATGLLGVINDVLDFSKIEASKLSLEAAPFSLVEQVRNIMDIIRFKSTEKNIDLTFRIAQDVLEADCFLGDAARLRQVLINLLGNAVKFTDKGGVVFEVECLEQTSENTLLLFSVHDTGIGIKPEVQALLFQPFSQADGSITRRFGGTGLGLAISQQLVQLMGGKIWLESEADIGSTFYFSIPFTKAEKLPSVKHPHISSWNSLHGKRVLLVEDNEVNQMIAQSLLEQVGILSHVAANGQEALEFLAHTEVDLILMDIQMPILDGLEATRRIRCQKGLCGQRGAQVPIVAMTAHAMDNDHAKSLAAGMNAHITKPIEPECLFATLAEWLN